MLVSGPLYESAHDHYCNLRAQNFAVLTRLAVMLHLLEMALFPVAFYRIFIHGTKGEKGYIELCGKERLFYPGADNSVFYMQF